MPSLPGGGFCAVRGSRDPLRPQQTSDFVELLLREGRRLCDDAANVVGQSFGAEASARLNKIGVAGSTRSG